MSNAHSEYNMIEVSYLYNLQLLTIEIYKAKHDLKPKFIGEIFVEKNISYSLRGNNHLLVPIPRTNA